MNGTTWRGYRMIGFAVSCRPVALAAVLLLCGVAARAQSPLEDFYREFTAQWIRAHPDLAVSTAYFTGEEQDRLERELTPVTRQRYLDAIARARVGLEQLQRFDLDAAPQALRVSGEVMRWQLEQVVEEERWLDYRWPLQQMGGANVTLVNQLTVVHPMRAAKDADSYLARLALLEPRMREATAEATRRAQAGIVPPDFILDATVAQMQRFIAPGPAENPLVTTLAEKSADLADLPTARREALLEQAAAVVANSVYPAWRDAVAELQRQRALATADAGVWRLPGGAAYYAYQLRRFTSTDLDAATIHAIGLSEVARIEAEMDTLLRELGLAEGSVSERVKVLKARLAYPDTDEGHARIMADIEVYIRDAEARARQFFDTRPNAPVIAQPYPRFRWANAAASYTSPPRDGSRPGVFQMPLRPDRLTNFGLRSLTYHETVPGHHFQLALVSEDANLPGFMQTRAFGSVAASSEGWALYAEQLAAEAGWYEGDVAGLLGQLDAALFRARRLVVDTGLHAKGWTRQQAIDYGISPSEVERYVVNPGQACSYMIGKLRLLELREQARAALGEAFSLREFHNVVLGLGVVPLTILEREVARYAEAPSSE